MYHDGNRPLVYPLIIDIGLSFTNENNNAEFSTMKLNPIRIIKINNIRYNLPLINECYTYFNHFQSYWKDIKIKPYTSLDFLLALDQQSYPYLPYRSMLTSIHSPNSLPYLGKYD